MKSLAVALFWPISRFLGGASHGRAGVRCGITAGEHARSFWLIRASRPIHQSCPRTTVCADVMLVGSRSRAGFPAPAWSRQIIDRLNGVAPYRYPPATSSKVSWPSPMDGEPIHLHRAQEEPVRFFDPRSVSTLLLGVDDEGVRHCLGA
jgi:hypothetical protein